MTTSLQTVGSPEPRTKAGQALLAREAYNSRSFPLITAEAIVAIEIEAARAAAKAALRLVKQANETRAAVGSPGTGVEPDA